MQRFLPRCSYTIVAQVGQPSGWPVFNKADIPTPHKRRNSSGSNNRYLLEATTMAMFPVISHSAFTVISASMEVTR
ncbi:ash family protein [Acerihabitans sp. TG2]|uniref:ash family protein n=1 Tax=Acerihabitans sp. TG2 TaxID=3096008 RepID=UPI002B232A1F|nr:ash family protein [Acerihabitans sp. TG2]MEA9389303.1 ash family protein [Acerihabitans sp. TG2]